MPFSVLNMKMVFSIAKGRGMQGGGIPLAHPLQSKGALPFSFWEIRYRGRIKIGGLIVGFRQVVGQPVGNAICSRPSRKLTVIR